MAKFFLLSKEHIKNGTRPENKMGQNSVISIESKFPKKTNWRRVCIVLSLLVLVEHVVMYYWWK